jgi:hypothetical protein
MRRRLAWDVVWETVKVVYFRYCNRLSPYWRRRRTRARLKHQFGRAPYRYPPSLEYSANAIDWISISRIFMSIPPWALNTTMHVDHPLEMETCIKQKIAIGFYGNTRAVIRYAFRRMQSGEERVFKGLH